MGAKPSGIFFSLLLLETLGKIDGELAGEQSGVDFLSVTEQKKERMKNLVLFAET